VNTSYREIINKLESRILRLLHEVGEQHFKNKCMMTIRKKLKVPNDYSQGMMNLCVAFCLDQESDDVVNMFRNDFVIHFSNAVDKSDNLMKLQYYEEKNPLLIQFYDPVINTQEEIAPQFFLSFTKEGFVLSIDEVI
jgi:hypothetical protein